jgi:tRNA A-37 threonylcarbamoyl transferase component Bud32
MSPDRWAHVKELFHDALECEPSERSSFLRDACGRDESLRAAVESLLAQEPAAREFLEWPATGARHGVADVFGPGSSPARHALAARREPPSRERASPALPHVGVVLRSGIEYALARGLVLSLVPAIGVAVLIDVLVHGNEPLFGVLRSRGWAYLLLGAVAFVIHTQRRRWSEAIDRRFFREHYDARQLLRTVADGARTAGSLERAAPRVVAQIEAALHPEFAAVMLCRPGESDLRTLASSPGGLAPPNVPANPALLEPLIDRNDRPVPVSLLSAARRRHLPAEAVSVVQVSGIDLVVPIQIGDGGTQAILVLGPKRSDQPYHREDLELLTTIASSLALLLEGPQAPRTPPAETFAECPECGSCYDSGTPSCGLDRSPLVPVGMPRTLAGRYHFERRLGRGGMGKVYEAVDGALDRRVAVKLIRDEWVYSQAAARRFEREARVVAGLAHPNVVTVFDFGVEAGTRAFMVMELLQGVTLRAEIHRARRLDAQRTVEVLRGVCAAVEAAHRRQLVHRDLKPANVFLARAGAGDGATVKVLDFGVAKPLLPWDETPAGAGADETDVGMLVGTVGYMPPEQLLGERPAFSWDLWALTTMAYESLTGVLPFPVPSRDAWRQAVLASCPTPVSVHLPGASPGLEDFFARALATDRRQRPQSAASLISELERVLCVS